MLLAIEFTNLHQILRNLYTEMMPLCGNMIGVAKGMAGLGALFYVSYRIWQSLARAEPIDVFPLLRPFVIGLCIMFFPTFVLGTINTVLSPVVKGCNQMLQTQVFSVEQYAKERDQLEREALLRNPETAYLVNNEEFDKRINALGFSPKDVAIMGSMHMERMMFNLKQSIRNWFHELLEILFKAAALIIDTIRTFFLIVLSILGPIAFALSIYDGFQSTLTQWISRYISVYLWLPVSDLFSSILARIQTLMLKADIAAMQNDPTFSPDGASVVYIIFMLIGIVGYFTIPSVSGWIIQAGGMGAYNKNLTSSAKGAGKMAGSGASRVAGGAMVAGGAIAAAGGAVAGNIAGRLKKS